ncbi:uncharacterized protein LOC119767087 [Culex quinquefasciatus]|uniref:uncharacterized protein LOC119767087 n=1 Tax=Culex quinquefasciatus TaxID=7176 RepID=UPI0018E2F9C8|nr:uncharacterized protein LOC119767087 [Culex quinquefasciatus]
MRPVNLDQLPTVSHFRPASPVVSNYDPADAHLRTRKHAIRHHSALATASATTSASQQSESSVSYNSILSTPLGVLPCRVQKESVLSRTFYFSARSTSRNRSCEVVIRDEFHRPSECQRPQ